LSEQINELWVVQGLHNVEWWSYTIGGNMAMKEFSPSKHFLLQTSTFVDNFYSGANFCGKKLAVILFCRNLFLRIAKKPAKIAKIITCKNLVPHGSLGRNEVCGISDQRGGIGDQEDVITSLGSGITDRGDRDQQFFRDQG